FVQIGDENVHRVRAVMDEVFGDENCVTEILVKKKGSQKGGTLDPVNDFILWYGKNAKSSGQIKIRSVYEIRDDAELFEDFPFAELRDGQRLRVTELETRDARQYTNDIAAFRKHYPDAKLFAANPLKSGGDRRQQSLDFPYQGRTFPIKAGQCWKHTVVEDDGSTPGMSRLAMANRLYPQQTDVRFVRHSPIPSIREISNWWDGFGGAPNQVYVVQTNERVIERLLLMASDPGDLVLDPTCGSGTTATVAEQWGRRWITIDTSRVALALARARIMGARYPFYLLADSREGQLKEAEVTRTAPSSQPVQGNIRHGFVYERAVNVTSGSVANNAEIDVIWDQWQAKLEPLREKLNAALKLIWQEWEIPRELPGASPTPPPAGAGEGGRRPGEGSRGKTIQGEAAQDFEHARKLHADWWQARIARQQEIDKSIAAKAEFEYLYDKPYEDKRTVRVAGPFTVESLSPHRVLGVDENDDLIDPLREKGADYGVARSFPQMILENLKTAGVQQAHKEDRITFTALTPWPGEGRVCAEGRYLEGEVEKRAGIFIGPEFGTVQRADLVEAARECGDAGFDVLIASAFNYEAHATEFNKLGRIPVLKARMNADLHMAEDLKNTGKGNLFVIFGEPDITVTSGQWLVARGGRLIANYEHAKELSGLGSLDEINRAGRTGLSAVGEVSARGKVRTDEPVAPGGDLGGGEHRGRGGAGGNEGVSPVSGDRQRIACGDGDLSDSSGPAGIGDGAGHSSVARTGGGRWSHAQRTQAVAALQTLSEADFPLALTTDHRAQVTVHGVDVFKPQTGEVISDGADGIACWFIDTDYNEESFFVRHAYFLGANDPYSALKTTLKAEINAEAWATLNSDTSRPFEKPKSGRIAVKVINHLGDEVMKVFKV
ncbi:MAG: DNA methyltransferase, partial [Limisphaerales bacterium]